MTGPAQADDKVYHLDGGDLSCARLLILLREHTRQLPAGTVVHLATTDPIAPIDLPAWCHMTGHTYLGPIPAAVPTYAVQTAADPAPTDERFPWKLDKTTDQRATRTPGGQVGRRRPSS